MIKKKFRLSTTELKNFFEQKFLKFNINNLKIFYQQNNLPYPKFAVICKKNLFKKSTSRNKIKRRIYSIIDQLIKNKKLKNLNFVIIPEFREIENEDFALLETKIKDTLQKLMV